MLKFWAQVMAVDNSFDALEAAQNRLDVAGSCARLNLELRWADTLRLSATLGRRSFDTLLDCAMLHCFAPRQQRKYLDSLATQVSAELHTLCCDRPVVS